MDPTCHGSEVTTRIMGMLTAEGLDPSYVAFVRRHVTEPDAAWRWCCGSTCDPCVERLGRVVDATRKTFALAPPIGTPGIPPGGESK